jgi:large subunit ribosomal protein L37Ae
MARKTKKVGSAGRYQARYGVRARTRVREIETLQRKKHLCPQCGQNSVKRTSSGIWKCKKCGTTIAGGAYNPRTEQGIAVEKMIKTGVSETKK